MIYTSKIIWKIVKKRRKYLKDTESSETAIYIKLINKHIKEYSMQPIAYNKN